MNELQAILTTFQHLQASGQPAAIATVVQTSGSVYRRPGACMLMTATGETVGAISGGCLERDVLERAQQLMQSDQVAAIVQYDTTASDDIIWGLGLGCNGTVQVLIESLTTATASQRLTFIAECLQQQQPGAIATVFQTTGIVATHVAERLYRQADGTVVNGMTDAILPTHLLPDLDQAIATGKTQVKTYTSDQGTVDVLLEVIQPPLTLLIFGAGYDAIPLVQLAKYLGWQVMVIDHRPGDATRDRFPNADRVICCQPTDLPTKLTLTTHMAAVVMTHHYQHDQTLLQTLIPSPLPYLGMLGPKRRTQQLLTDLQHNGMTITPQQQQRIHAPIGLDIGAETPVEIALAIAAEVQAVFAGYGGGYLRDREGPIHGEENK